MTNLDVLRAVQHVAWPAYCWPFANGSAGNGYALGSSPSPPGLTMVESKLSITASPETSSSSSNRAKRSRSHSRTPSSYEEHLLKMTSIAATTTTPSPPSSSPPGTKGTNSDVKSERLSPDSVNNNSTATTNNNNNDHRSANSPSSKTKQKDIITSHGGNCTPSPSASPKSHVSNRTRTPSSFPGTPPHPAFTPPISLPPGCFSPAALGSLGAMGGIPGGPGNLSVLSRAQNFMESPLPRNCSDLMRSMAAKYNTNPGVTNNVEFFNSHVAKPFPRLPINPLVATKQNYQAMNSNISQSTGCDQPQSSRSLNPGDSYNPSDTTHSRGVLNRLPPGLLPANGTQNSFPVPTHNPLNNLSSTQALLDMVRNASHHVTSRIQTPPHVVERDVPANDRDKPDQSLNYLNSSAKRAAESSCPLDLSSSVSAKRSRTEESSGIYASVENLTDYRHPSLSSLTASSEFKPPAAQPNVSTPACKSSEDILSWTVDDVCDFVRSIDLCAEYADVFREQRIDGWCLSLLTESHLTTSLDMKLGPALRLRAILSSKTGQHQQQMACSQCTSCQNSNVHDGNHESDQHGSISLRSPTHSHSQRSPLPSRTVRSPGSSHSQKSPVPSRAVRSPGSSHSESPTHSLSERSGFCHDSPQYFSSPQPSEGERTAKPSSLRGNRSPMTNDK